MAKSKSTKRQARRLFRKYPLFALEFLSDKFEGYDSQKLASDLSGMKPKKKRRSKDVLKRFGRYPVMQKHLKLYKNTGDLDHLFAAQRLRNVITKPYRIRYHLNGDDLFQCLPPTYSYDVVKDFASIKFKSFEELEEKIKAKMQYAGAG